MEENARREVGARGEERVDGQLRTQSLLAESLAIEAAIADSEMGIFDVVARPQGYGDMSMDGGGGCSVVVGLSEVDDVRD